MDIYLILIKTIHIAPFTARESNTPEPILHLDETQTQKFKHTNPDQSEPDIVFPKNADSLFAADEAQLDKEAKEMEIELNRVSSDQMDDEDDDDDDTMEEFVSADDEEDEDEEDYIQTDGGAEDDDEEEEGEEEEDGDE